MLGIAASVGTCEVVRIGLRVALNLAIVWSRSKGMIEHKRGMRRGRGQSPCYPPQSTFFPPYWLLEHRIGKHVIYNALSALFGAISRVNSIPLPEARR